MKLSYLLICPVLIVLFITGCDLLDISGDAEKNLTYPLLAGSVWEYDREFGVYNFRSSDNPDSVIESEETYVYGHSTVRSNGTLSLDAFANISGAVYELEQTYSEGLQEFTATSWNYYTRTDDGLYMVGYKSAAGAPAMPKPAAGHTISRSNDFYILFDGEYFPSVRALSEYVEFMVKIHTTDSGDFIIEETPLKVFPRFMLTGYQWTYRAKGNPWRVDKRILGREIIDVAAGQFECYKVQWFIDIQDTGDWDENLVYYDYISDEGLIKREFYFKDQVWISAGSPEQKGYFDAHDISVLTGFELTE